MTEECSNVVRRNVIPQPAITTFGIGSAFGVTLVGGLLGQFRAEH
jgi:hypothetical protein